jgi:hypothetical protein
MQRQALPHVHRIDEAVLSDNPQSDTIPRMDLWARTAKFFTKPALFPSTFRGSIFGQHATDLRTSAFFHDPPSSGAPATSVVASTRKMIRVCRPAPRS